MSLTVEGASVPSFSYANIPRTILSPSFISRLGPSRPTGYLFTVTVGPSGSFSFPLHCTLGPQSPFDVVLGYDWAAYCVTASCIMAFVLIPNPTRGNSSHTIYSGGKK
ncbi:hypothetical protein DFH09DRAFT_1272243 [Mycena vulgaris]|nr:hypothetical protein DFH09DRAFT_1272243 [Mycena vulgaris]